MLVEMEQIVLKSFKTVLVLTLIPSKITAIMLSIAIIKGKAKVQGPVFSQAQLLSAQQLHLGQLLLVMLGTQALQLQPPHRHLGLGPELEPLGPGPELGLEPELVPALAWAQERG